MDVDLEGFHRRAIMLATEKPEFLLAYIAVLLEAQAFNAEEILTQVRIMNDNLEAVKKNTSVRNPGFPDPLNVRVINP